MAQVLESKLLKNFARDLYLEKVFPVLKQERNRQFMILTMTIAAIGFFSIFAISPTLNTIAELQKQLEDNKFVDEQLQTKISNLSTLEQKYAAIQDFLPVIYAALPQTPQTATLVGEIQGLADDNRIKLARIQTSSPLAPVKPSTKESSFNVEIDADGRFDDISNFLKALGSFDRILTIDTIQMGIPQISLSASDPSLMHLTIRAKAHFKTEVL